MRFFYLKIILSLLFLESSSLYGENAPAETPTTPSYLQIRGEAFQALNSHDLDKAIELGLKSKLLYEESLDHPEKDEDYRKLLLLFALSEGGRGRFAEAVVFVSQYIEMAEADEGEPSAIASAESTLGFYLFKQGFHARGLDKMIQAVKKLSEYKEEGNIDLIQIYWTQCDLLISVGLVRSAEYACKMSGRPFIGKPLDFSNTINLLLFARYYSLLGETGGIDLARTQLAHIEQFVRDSKNFPAHINYHPIAWGIFVTTADLYAARGREARDAGNSGLMVEYFLNAQRAYYLAEDVSAKEPNPKGIRLSQSFTASKTANAIVSALHDLRSVDEARATTQLGHAKTYLQTALDQADDPRILVNARLRQQLAQVALIRARVAKTPLDVAAIESEYRAALDLYLLHIREFSEFETTRPFLAELADNQNQLLSDYLSFYFAHRSSIKTKFPITSWVSEDGSFIDKEPVLRAESKDLVIDLRVYYALSPDLVNEKTAMLAALVVTEDGSELVSLGPLSEIDFEDHSTAYTKIWLPMAAAVGVRHLRRILLIKEKFSQDFLWDEHDLPPIRVEGKTFLTKFSDLGVEFLYPSSIQNVFQLGSSYEQN